MVRLRLVWTRFGCFGKNSIVLVATCFSLRCAVALDIKPGGGITVRGDNGFGSAVGHCQDPR